MALGARMRDFTRTGAGMLTIYPLTDIYPWEMEWLKSVLSDLGDVKLASYSIDTPVEDNALYLYNSDRGLELDSSFVSALKSRKGVGLLHIGDEYLRTDLSHYGNFAYIVRMYYSVEADCDGVFTIPLGPTPGLGEGGNTLASKRNLTWMFAGDWKSDRSQMADVFREWPGGLLSLPMPYKDEARISREQYLLTMADTVFAPCPAGNVVLETCRPYEALLFGAIPLLPKRRGFDVYKHMFGDHPLPTFLNWKEALSFARDLHTHPEKLDALQQECLSWWTAYQERMREDIAQFVEDGRAGVYQSELQKTFTDYRQSKVKRLRALLVQQNFGQLRARFVFRVIKYWRALTGRSEKPTWSIDPADMDKSEGKDGP